MVFILCEAQQQKRPPKKNKQTKRQDLWQYKAKKKPEQEWLALVEAF